MGSVAPDLKPVSLSAHAFRIHGKAEVILCASLFYFRIPRAHWRERMMQLKAFGYNCIDVYFPWNYHEEQEGVWDFAGEKDIEAFLQTAAEVGLWVVARPGPYICSEWDGGALPAYLNVKEGMKLRDNNQAFLEAVAKWFDRVLPTLRKFQISESGTIICVQLDNELDFYGCADPNGYISALRDMAIGHGFTVPLIACAGQGGIYEASGLAQGVVPTCNFYPNDRDPVFEEKVLAYWELLKNMELPLLVTETNRSHYLLRRLLSCGVKLLGPYLQVSGTDFGFTNSTNNWGKPLAFLTSDYDFGGMISPEGHIRPEAYEGLLLSRMIAAYGSTLAEAEPAATGSAHIASMPDNTMSSAQSLKLRDGGHLVFVTNIGDAAADVTIGIGDIQAPQVKKLAVQPWRSVALPFGVPLQTWGVEGTLVYSTAELFHHKKLKSRTVLLFHTELEGEIVLKLHQPTLVEAHHATADVTEDTVTLTFRSAETSRCKLNLPDGHILEVIAMDRAQALLVEDVDADGTVRYAERFAYRHDPVEQQIPWTVHSVQTSEPMAESRISITGATDYLEKYGIYKGFAWYETRIDRDPRTNCEGVLIQKASDIVSLYAEKEYVATVVPGGTSCYIPVDLKTRVERLTARVEIWGHSNFDDIRLPALRLDAMRGLKGLVAVTNVLDLTQNWKVKTVQQRDIQQDLTNPAADDSIWPIVGFGGWLSPDHPVLAYFRNRFAASKDADSWTLHFAGMQATAQLFVNGQDAGRVLPSDPCVDITPFVEPGTQVQLAVFMERLPNLHAGRVIVYEGTSAKYWRIASCQEEQLWHSAMNVESSMPIELPLSMSAGEVAWLLGELKDSNDGKGWRVKVKGSNMKLTVMFNTRIVGRLWLKGSRSRPAYTGGNQESFYLPGPWFQEGAGKLAVLLEAVDGEEPSRLESFSFIPVQMLSNN